MTNFTMWMTNFIPQKELLNFCIFCTLLFFQFSYVLTLIFRFLLPVAWLLLSRQQGIVADAVASQGWWVFDGAITHHSQNSCLFLISCIYASFHYFYDFSFSDLLFIITYLIQSMWKSHLYTYNFPRHLSTDFFIADCILWKLSTFLVTGDDIKINDSCIE